MRFVRDGDPVGDVMLHLKRRWFARWASVVFVLSVLVLDACVASGSVLPEKRPDDFEASFSFNGGMLPYSESLHIAADESTYRLFKQGLEIVIHFQVSDEELDSLYKTLREDQFDRIQSREEQVYDRGGYSMSMQANGESYHVSDSGVSFVLDEWSDEFADALTRLQQTLRAYAEPDDRSFVIQWDESLFAASRLATVEIDVGDRFAGVTGTTNGTAEMRVFTTAQRAYEVRVTPEGGSQQTFSVGFSASGGIRVAWVEGQIVAEAVAAK